MRIRALRVSRDTDTWQRAQSALQAKAQVRQQLAALPQTAFAISWKQVISHEHLIKTNQVSLVMVGLASYDANCFDHLFLPH